MAPTNEEVAYPGKESTPETVREILSGIADRNAGSDLGRLAQLLFDSAEGNLSVDTEVTDPGIAPEVGTRRFDSQGQEYEWQEDGWHRVEVPTQVSETVATSDPVTRQESVAPTVGAVGPADGPTVPSENPAVDPGTTPPVSGTPGAPNTTVSEGSQEGSEV